MHETLFPNDLRLQRTNVTKACKEGRKEGRKEMKEGVPCLLVVTHLSFSAWGALRVTFS